MMSLYLYTPTTPFSGDRTMFLVEGNSALDAAEKWCEQQETSVIPSKIVTEFKPITLGRGVAMLRTIEYRE